MKIKNLAIIVLMTIFFIILGTNVFAATGTINSEAVKLRKQPNSKIVVDLLNKGDEVEILEQGDGWYKVKATTGLGKVTGYIDGTTIDLKGVNKENSNTVEKPNDIEKNEEILTTGPSTDKEIANTVTNIEENNEYTLKQDVSIKILPLINSIEKAKITGNIKIVEIINDWAKVESDTETGWIRTNTLKQSLIKAEETIEQPEQQEQVPETIVPETITKEPEKIEEPKETETTINKVGYVDAEGLVIRKEPSASSEQLHSLSRNSKVEIIGQSGKWYKINWNGEIGYVSAKYISDTKLPETTTRSGSTLKTEETTTQTEVVKKENAVTEKPVQSTTGTTGAAIVEYAKKYLGYKYVSGGASPSTGFDCSGFTTYVYKHFGITLNRTSRDQIKNGVAVEKSNLQPGDLVIFNNDANTKIGHVGIYIGNGNFIHASNPKGGVKITTLTSGYYHQRYVGARRVI